MSYPNRPTASRPNDVFHDPNAYFPRLDSPNPHGFIPWNNQAQQQNQFIIPPHDSQLPNYNYESPQSNYHQSQESQFPTFPTNPSPLRDNHFEDDETFVDETPAFEASPPELVARQTGRKKKTIATKAKARKWTSAEELALTQAYIDTSEDSVDGNAQKADRFWNTVEAKFYEIQEVEPYRSKHAVSTKWKEMNQKLTKWAGIITNLNAMRASGESDEMIQSRALEEYRLVSNGHSFSLHACYDIVKQSPRWRAPPQPSNHPHQPASKRSKTSHSTEGGTSSDGRCFTNLNDLNDANASDDEPQRPPGRDQARKAKKGQGSTGTAVTEELVDQLNTNMNLFASSYQNQIAFEREKYEEKKKERQEKQKERQEKQKQRERFLAQKDREHELRILAMAGQSESARLAVERMAREIAEKYHPEGSGSGGN